jgi:hypothetical protein
VFVSPALRKILYWAPRVLCIAFILFVASFSLHVFDEYLDTWNTVTALLRHLVPAFIFAMALLFAWMWEWVGALLFLTFACYYAAENLRHPRWILSISAPLFVVGLLFLVNWMMRERVEKTPH